MKMYFAGATCEASFMQEKHCVNGSVTAIQGPASAASPPYQNGHGHYGEALVRHCVQMMAECSADCT